MSLILLMIDTILGWFIGLTDKYGKPTPAEKLIQTAPSMQVVPPEPLSTYPSKPSFVPNGVLFKLDSGKPCIVKKEFGVWNWDQAYIPNEDHWPDLASGNPFEFIFIQLKGLTVITDNSKTTIPNNTFLSLHESNLLRAMIEDDYQRRFSK